MFTTYIYIAFWHRTDLCHYGSTVTILAVYSDGQTSGQDSCSCPVLYANSMMLNVLRMRLSVSPVTDTPGGVAQSVERATPDQEILGSTPPPPLHSCAGSLLVRSHLTRYNVTSSVSVWQHIKLSGVSLMALPRDSLVADKEGKKP